ncbi:MAG TPA: hypothetical protein VIK55_10820 [Paludibacter sp.]
MKTNELQNIWKNIDSEINLKTNEELNQYLAAKTRKTINKFLLFIAIDIIVSVGLIVFLIITALNRQSDIIYLLNNSILCLITLSLLIISLLSWKKIQNNKYNLPLKDCLEQRIKLLSSWLSGKYSKLYIVLIPILLIMIMISIHVYFEYKLFIEVMKDEESIFGQIVGLIIGLIFTYSAVTKIRKFQIKNLEFLKDLHARLSTIQ